MSVEKKLTLKDVRSLVEQRLNRISGGSQLFKVRTLLDKAIEDTTENSMEIITEALDVLNTVSQPTAGRKKIVEDINSLLLDFCGSVDQKVDADKVDADKVDADKVDAIEDTEEKGKLFMGRKKKITKTFKKKNSEVLSSFEVGTYVYIDGDQITAVEGSDEVVVLDTPLTITL